MSLTEAQRRANDKYIAQNYKQVKLSMPKEEAEELENFCKEEGYTKAGFIRGAIKEKMEKIFNAHSYAISLEKILKVPAGSADAIERNPLEYMKGFLDKEYDKSEEKAAQIDSFDEKYGKYKDMRLGEWSESDAAQMVKDLREILSR